MCGCGPGRCTTRGVRRSECVTGRRQSFRSGWLVRRRYSGCAAVATVGDTATREGGVARARAGRVRGTDAGLAGSGGAGRAGRITEPHRGACGMTNAELIDRVRHRLAVDGAATDAATVAGAVRAESGGVAGHADVLHAVRQLRREFTGAGRLQPLLDD